VLGGARRLGSRRERAEHAAAKEEQRIRGDIADLPAGWFVMHAPDIDELGSDEPSIDPLAIDHLAIGPAGVFMVYMQHRPGAKVWVSERTLTIDGRESELLRQARFAARRASGLLSDELSCGIIVQSVIVLIDAATVQMISHPADVHVRDQHDLRDWMCRQPGRLEPAVVRAIYDRYQRL
jgi:Nuclease-related domain